jgi:hypothetical protein
MTRPRPFSLSSLLAVVSLAIAALGIAACATERKPIRGFDKPPPGTIVLNDASGGTVIVWPIFALPDETQTFRARFNGHDAVYVTSQDGFYDYAEWQMQGWTGGWDDWFPGIAPGTYVVELVDSAGQSWGKSAPLAVPAGGGNRYDSTVQNPAVVFTHYDDQVGSWNIDPSTQDADMATDEITVTNLLGEDVVVERCTIAGGDRTSCTPVGTIAPKADLRTVETQVALAMPTPDHPALFIHLASDASQSYQRDLIQVIGPGGATCQVERIFVHGVRQTHSYSPNGPAGFAMSTCFGNSGGPPSNP